MVEMEKEKDDMKNELLDCKEKILKFADKEKKWQKDVTSVVASEKTFKEKHDEIKRKL